MICLGRHGHKRIMPQEEINARLVQLAREGRLRMVDGDRTDLLPGIDLRVAYDTHSPAFMWVVVRNDEKSESADTWVLAGDLVYVYENISGDERSPVWRKCTGQLHSQ